MKVYLAGKMDAEYGAWRGAARGPRGTHQPIRRGTSEMSMSDETTPTELHDRHEQTTRIVYRKGRAVGREEAVCSTCWISTAEGQHRAPWPCEITRLRERVAALEGAGEKMHDALWAYWFPRGATPERDEAGRQAIKAWRLALTQADERQGGER